MEISDDVFAAAEGGEGSGGCGEEGEEEGALSPRPPAPRRHHRSAARQPGAGDAGEGGRGEPAVCGPQAGNRCGWERGCRLGLAGARWGGCDSLSPLVRTGIRLWLPALGSPHHLLHLITFPSPLTSEISPILTTHLPVLQSTSFGIQRKLSNLASSLAQRKERDLGVSPGSSDLSYHTGHFPRYLGVGEDPQTEDQPKAFRVGLSLIPKETMTQCGSQFSPGAWV